MGLPSCVSLRSKNLKRRKDGISSFLHRSNGDQVACKVAFILVLFLSTWLLVSFSNSVISVVSIAPRGLLRHDNVPSSSNAAEAEGESSLWPRVRPLRPGLDYQKYTVRLNTFQRDDQLRISVSHHVSCPSVAQVVVVWYEAAGPVPAWLQNAKNTNARIRVERHDVNSLNERFHILHVDAETPYGILSVDDDVLAPCIALEAGFLRWTQHPDRMVGYDARPHEIVKSKHDNDTFWKYGYLATTERTNRYSITLSRYAFVHRDYLDSYMTTMPASIRQKVADNLNCEDIALSFWVSACTQGQPPLLADYWALRSRLRLYVQTAISSGRGHKAIRDECVDEFATTLQLKTRLQTAVYVHYNQPLVAHDDHAADVEFSGPNETKHAQTMRRLCHGPTDDEFAGFLHCGNPTESSAAATTLNIERTSYQLEFDRMIQRWKQDGLHSAVLEIKSHGRDMTLPAYTAGLVEYTEPWEKKYHHHHHSHSK
jgi:glucuronyl/N-acetylglucosaminyl transferase EXT2